MPHTIWRDRVAVDPDIHHGQPCVKGTRVSVTVIVGSLADGMTAEQILEAYPQLVQDDIAAALAYAAEVLHHDVLLPLEM